mgnify:CR=1 FL=1
MKFLGIKALKKELSEGSLKQLDVFRYWLASTIVIQLAVLPISAEPAVWDYLYWVISTVVAVVMLRRCYLANGGASGVKFSDKIVSISWVMVVRGFLMVFVPLLIIGSIFATLAGLSLGFNDEELTAFVENSMIAEILVFELWVWLRTAVHIRDVR